MTEPRKEASKLGQFSWALFDWANQPFFTVITTFIFAPYFANAWSAIRSRASAAGPSPNRPPGMLIALLSPFLGAMADAGGRRKPYIFFFQLLVAVGCVSLWWAYPQPPRPGRPDQLGGRGGHGRRGDVDRVQQRAAARHRAARAHGLAERLRLGPGLLRRPVCAVRRAGREQAVDVRPVGDNDQPLFGLDPQTYEVERLVGPASAIWLAVFVIPMFLFTPDRRQAAQALAARAPRAAAAARCVDTVRKLAPLPQRAALPDRLHALQRRARRHHRLRRRLCRGDLRLEHGDARHLRHHPHRVRHSRRLPRAAGSTTAIGSKRTVQLAIAGVIVATLGIVGVTATPRALRRPGARSRQPDARPVRLGAGEGVHGLRPAAGLLHGPDAGGQPHHDRPPGARRA